MTASGFQKTGWHWTRKGWKRSPKHLLAVKKVPLPTKRKTRKKVRITTAPPTEKPPTFAEARKLAIGQGRADSAPPQRRRLKSQPRAKRGGRGAGNITTSPGRRRRIDQGGDSHANPLLSQCRAARRVTISST